MKLKFVTVLIVVAICCLNVAADSDDDEIDACIENYLKQKGKLARNFPVVPVTSTVKCRFASIFTVTLVRRIIVHLINAKHPNDATCLASEFENHETTDLIVKLNVIDDSKLLSENEMQTQTNETRMELKHDLIKIAIQCGTEITEFIATFNEFLGIKNVTLSAQQHNYCFAKYAADNGLLPLQNVDLNPYGIQTTHIDCPSIMRKERRAVEQTLRSKTKENMPDRVSCVINAYRNKKIFDTSIASKVLEYVELSKEVKKVETDKVVEKVVDFTFAVASCAMI